MEFATKSHPANLFQRISMPCQATVCYGILNVCWYWTRFVCLALPRRGAQTCARVCAGENCAGTGGQGARPSTCSEVRPYMGMPTHVENTSVTYLLAVVERKPPPIPLPILLRPALRLELRLLSNSWRYRALRLRQGCVQILLGDGHPAAYERQGRRSGSGLTGKGVCGGPGWTRTIDLGLIRTAL